MGLSYCCVAFFEKTRRANCTLGKRCWKGLEWFKKVSQLYDGLERSLSIHAYLKVRARRRGGNASDPTKRLNFSRASPSSSYGQTAEMATPRTQPSSSLIPSSQTAASLLASLKSAPRASSGCSSLDALLSPKSSSSSGTKQGLEPGSVLEIMGPPGVGKSRCCLGFALVQRFAELEKGGGRGGQVLVVGQSDLSSGI